MNALAASLIALCAWSVIALRQIDWISSSAAGLTMCAVCGAGLIGCLLAGISLVVPMLALTALAFGASVLWSFGYLR